MSGPSRSTPDRSARPPAAGPAVQRRYTEEELALILNRAAERQEGAHASVPRYTLSDIQEIAAGAGIAPEHVASVAASLGDRRAQAGSGVLGAPHRFHFEESIDGEISDEVIAGLFDVVRRETGLQGSVSDALGTLQWKGQETGDGTYVSVSRRGGRTTIGVLDPRTESASVVGILGAFGAVAASAGLATALVGGVGLEGALVPIGAIAGGAGTAWAATRAVWRRFARRTADRVETIGATLVATSRRAVEEGRVLTDR